MTAPSEKTVATVWERDMGMCVRCYAYIFGDRGRGWSLHHRRPRGSGGTSLKWVNLPANLILLCGSGTTGCHGWVESHRADSRKLGFLVSLNGTEAASHVPIHHAGYGLVLLDDLGGVHDQTVVF